MRSFFWSVFSCIRTEKDTVYLSYSVRMRENTDQKNLRIWTLFTQSNLFRSINFCSQYQITIEIRASDKQIGGMGGIASNPPIGQVNVLCDLTGF